MNAAQRRIGILGAGAWGTALACVFARNGHQTLIWARRDDIASSINRQHENPTYLPDIKLPQALMASIDLLEVVQHAEILLLVTPAQTIGDISETISNMVSPDVPLILCAKGINRKTGKLPAETVSQYLPKNRIAALSGPSFASDVANNLPTAVTLAAERIELAEELSQIISDPAFRVYASNDLKGVELGGALKNVIALAVGICRGMGLGASAEAALIARGFAELNRLAVKLGARPSTLMGLSGLGDLVLTCSGEQSRNFAYGMTLGKVDKISAMPVGLKLAEGALTASIAARVARENAIDAPVISTVDQLMEGTITARQAVSTLLARPLKKE